MWFGKGGPISWLIGPRASEKSKGAALIEFAIALPLILMLILGMVSAAAAYNHQLAMTHATREAGRYAATLPVTNFASMDDWLDSVIDQVIADGTGSIGNGAPGQYICVAYVHPAGAVATDQTRRRIRNSSGLQPGEPNQQCFVDGRPNTERRVQVRVGREYDFSALFFSSTIDLDAEGVNRFEAGLGF